MAHKTKILSRFDYGYAFFEVIVIVVVIPILYFIYLHILIYTACFLVSSASFA